MRLRTNPWVVPAELRASPSAQPRAVAAPAPDASGLNEAQIALIKRALQFCFYSYWPLGRAKDELEKKLHCTDVKVFDCRCMQSICFTEGEFAYLAFRGSESLGDWLYNFAALPWFQPRRHLGFEAGWRCLRRQVMHWLETLNRPNVALVLTGHSLGGAIAQLAALDFASQGRRISNVVTFGAPKMAFLSTAEVYNATRANLDEKTLGSLTFCIVNQRDLVPRVPPKLFGFRNVGRGVLIDHEDRLHVGVEIESTLLDSIDDIINVVNVAPSPPEIALPAAVQRRLAKFPLSSKRETWPNSEVGRKVLETYLNVARGIPPLYIPLLYVRAVFELVGSGANHLSNQYWYAFSGKAEPPTSGAPRNPWGQLLKWLFLLLAAGVFLAGLAWTFWFPFRRV